MSDQYGGFKGYLGNPRYEVKAFFKGLLFMQVVDCLENSCKIKNDYPQLTQLKINPANILAGF